MQNETVLEADDCLTKSIEKFADGILEHKARIALYDDIAHQAKLVNILEGKAK
jgi:hypothetical protein